MEVPADPNATETPGAEATPVPNAAAYPPLPNPEFLGDQASPETLNFVRAKISEDRYNAFCIDCQRNRSDHCNVTFGTFICGECAGKHEAAFPMFMSYVKPCNTSQAWDTFQINMIKIGGNQRFFDFLKEYGKERDELAKKYATSAAQYYRRRLCAQAKNLPFTEEPPSKDLKEAVNKSLATTNAFISSTDEKYQISQKATVLGQ